MTRSVSTRTAVGFVARRELDLLGRIDRRADDDEGAGAKPAAVLEQEPHRQDAASQRAEAALGFEEDSRSAGLQRLQLRFVVADPLRKDRDDAAARELFVAAREGLEVLRGVGAFVLAAINRDDSGKVADLRQHGDLPQGALAEHAGGKSERPEEEHRVDQAVDVIGDDNQRYPARCAVSARHSLSPDDFDAAKEDRQNQTAKEADRPVDPRAHARRAGGARGDRSAQG